MHIALIADICTTTTEQAEIDRGARRLKEKQKELGCMHARLAEALYSSEMDISHRITVI